MELKQWSFFSNILLEKNITNCLNELTVNSFVVNLYDFEVGARGKPAKSFYNLLKHLGLSITTISSIVERASKAALAESYQNLAWQGVNYEPLNLHPCHKSRNLLGVTLSVSRRIRLPYG